MRHVEIISKFNKKKDTMIVYSDVLPHSELLKSIEPLYIGSFPPAERRKFDYVETLLEKDSVPFKMIAATEDGAIM